jgi:hypothetical protein
MQIEAVPRSAALRVNYVKESNSIDVRQAVPGDRSKYAPNFE